MKGLSLLNPPPVYFEIGQGSLKVLNGPEGLENKGRLFPPLAA